MGRGDGDQGGACTLGLERRGEVIRIVVALEGNARQAEATDPGAALHGEVQRPGRSGGRTQCEEQLVGSTENAATVPAEQSYARSSLPAGES